MFDGMVNAGSASRIGLKDVSPASGVDEHDTRRVCADLDERRQRHDAGRAEA
jgi:hypothetical protein